MLKKVIKYIDLEGNPREEEHWFHLSKPKLVELQLSQQGGLEEYLRKIIKTNDNTKIVPLFRQIILMSYGEKSPDGKTFIQNDQLSLAFEQTGAYDELFMELFTDGEAAGKFVNGILPKDLSDQVEKMQKEQKIENSNLEVIK